MNKAAIINYIVAHAGEDYPAQIREAIQRDPEIASAARRAEALRGLLAIKRYEQPDEHLETRILAKVRAGIRDVEQARVDGVAGAGWFRNLSLFRFGMAATVMSLVGMTLFTLQQETAPTSAFAPIAVTTAVPAIAAAAVQEPASNPSHALAREELPVIFLASNSQPGRINYGGGPVVPVRFDF